MSSLSFGAPGAFGDALRARLHDQRTVLVSAALDAETVRRLTEQLLVLDDGDVRPVTLRFSSAPGGAPDASLSLHDTIRAMDAPVQAVGSGRIAGGAVVAFVAAERRTAQPHARFALAPPELSAETVGTDVQAGAEQARALEARYVRLLADATGQAPDQVRDALRNKRHFDAEAARAYGLIEAIETSSSGG
jgi:ATP-dependent Clp protease protease subunit